MAKKKGKPQSQTNNYVANIDELHVPEIGFYGLAEQMTEEQRVYCESLIHNNITFCDSVAGSGKSTCAVAVAKYLYEHNLIDKLVYIINPCEQQTLGHLPGDVDEKIASYMGALEDALITIGEFPLQSFDKEMGWVEACSGVFMRGINLKKSFIIIDEAQNFPKSELKKVLTRISDDCFVACIGHSLQCDLKKPETSGFIPMKELFVNKGEEFGLKVGNVKLTKNFRGKISRLADTLEIN